LRGMNREEFLKLLGPGGKKGLPEGRKPRIALRPEEEDEISPTGVPLSADIPTFWGGHKLPEPLFGEVGIPPVPAALPRRLGNFPFWRGEIKFLEAMEAIYPRAAAYGLDLFLGVYPPGPMEKESLSDRPESTFSKERKKRLFPR
jgi:uncharacterized Zn finger protein